MLTFGLMILFKEVLKFSCPQPHPPRGPLLAHRPPPHRDRHNLLAWVSFLPKHICPVPSCSRKLQSPTRPRKIAGSPTRGHRTASTQFTSVSPRIPFRAA